MHHKDYIHHDFYVYSPVLLTQYLGHCWHTPCTELYILRISAWLLRKPPSPATGGGEPSGWGRGGVGVPAHIYIYIHLMYIHVLHVQCVYVFLSLSPSLSLHYMYTWIDIIGYCGQAGHKLLCTPQHKALSWATICGMM